VSAGGLQRARIWGRKVSFLEETKSTTPRILASYEDGRGWCRGEARQITCFKANSRRLWVTSEDRNQKGLIRKESSKGIKEAQCRKGDRVMVERVPAGIKKKGKKGEAGRRRR